MYFRAKVTKIPTDFFFSPLNLEAFGWLSGQCSGLQIMRSLVRMSLEKNSAHDCTVLYCTKRFIIIVPSSGHDLDNTEREVKSQIIIIC